MEMRGRLMGRHGARRPVSLAIAVAFCTVTALVGPGIVSAAHFACLPVLPNLAIFACPDGQALEQEAHRLAVPLAVDETSQSEAIQSYRHAVQDLAKAAKLTPLLFPGPPRQLASERDAKKSVLRGGYLFTANEAQARLWHRTLQFEDLYNSPTLTIRRGDSLMLLRRQARMYVHHSGMWAGRRARLLLFDQVAESEESLPPPAAFDLGRLRAELGVDTFDLMELSAKSARLRARFASGWTAEVLAIHTGERTVLLSSEPKAKLEEAVRSSVRLRAPARAILGAAEQMAAERLRFDEPKTEFGQQDGHLRVEWWRAFRAGRTNFVYNGDRYDVFDAEGRPYVPQVCIDFIVDAIDRAAGSWYLPRGESRDRVSGFIDLRAIRPYDSRSVRDTVRLAGERTEMWDRYDVPKSDWIPFRDRKRFREHLNHFPGGLREADILVIWGLRSDGLNHFHTYFVFETDPIHGLPVAFSDNAGFAAIRVVDDIMRAAPRRYIKHRLRLRPEWFLAQQGRAGVGSPAD